MAVETLSRDDRGNLTRHYHHDLDRVVGVFVDPDPMRQTHAEFVKFLREPMTRMMDRYIKFQEGKMIQNVTIQFNNGREVTFKGEAQVTDEDVTAGVAGIQFTDPYEDPATKDAETIPASMTDAPTKDESGT